MDIKKITNKSDESELNKIKDLYESAFPPNERKPLNSLLADEGKSSDVLAFYEDDVFLGFACMLTSSDITHIIYFAIDDILRNQGYGTEVLKMIHSQYKNNRIIVDIELLSDGALNNIQRERRKVFYINNNYYESNVKYDWQGESYEILIYNGFINYVEFNKFWDDIYNENKSLSYY